MITPLRTRHRRIFLALACLIPTLFAWGMLSRPVTPVMPSPTASITGATNPTNAATAQPGGGGHE